MFILFTLLVAGSILLINFPGCQDTQISNHRDLSVRERFRDARFGMFVHWGPVSLEGTEIGWSRGRKIPFEEYDQLYKKFNPKRFDAEKWVSLLKDAGMKYLVIVTKHHDGFVMWDSETTDYDIMSTPYNKDILEALSRECREQGILFGTYYSIADWWHPNYPLVQNKESRKEIADMSNPWNIV
jgi:alpha-L-fucosidase